LDQTAENVAMSFNKAIITGLLREKYRYDGVVCTDWGLIRDNQMPGTIWPARAWGVEHLSATERVLKALNAGVDQFGGESCPEYVIELVNSGQLSESRLDTSVRRLLRLKFQLGLFDNPFVDETKIAQVFGHPTYVASSAASQRRAMTLLKNEDHILPLSRRPRIFVKNIDPVTAIEYAEIVASPEEAELAILRLETPWIPIETKNPMARNFHHGDLDFKGQVKAEILSLLQTVPTVVVIYLDRPAVIPEISQLAKALLADYGATDEAVLDVIFGKASPEGKLPFELPSSMEAVQKQHAVVPYASENPLYPFGFGLSYANFEYHKLKIVSPVDPINGFRVTVTLKNSGSVVADEVVQLYLSALDVHIHAPLCQLIAFQRVKLSPGQTRIIRFRVTAEMLMLIDEDGRQIFAPGKYRLIAGGCSPSDRGLELGTPQPVSEEFTIS
jgi:beta-glucosidase